MLSPPLTHLLTHPLTPWKILPLFSDHHANHAALILTRCGLCGPYFPTGNSLTLIFHTFIETIDSFHHNFSLNLPHLLRVASIKLDFYSESFFPGRSPF